MVFEDLAASGIGEKGLAPPRRQARAHAVEITEGAADAFRGLVATSTLADVSQRGDFAGGARAISDDAALGAAGAEQVAEESGGFAIRDGNDLAAGLARVGREAASYYLLGYYSTNAKPDGKFHRITVRVKRPGVDIRARRGYNALTESEAASRDRALVPVDPETRSRDVALA